MKWIGLVAAAVFTLRKFASLSGVQREEIPGLPAPGDRHIAIFRLDGAMFFRVISGKVMEGVANLHATAAARRHTGNDEGLPHLQIDTHPTNEIITRGV